VGASTLNEYRKYIEKDGALERRFQTVIVEAPSLDETIEILKGLRKHYEDHHRVIFPDESLEAATKLSDRYIADRFLPDKAIDVVDEAGARARLGAQVPPPEVQELQEQLDELSGWKEEAIRDQDFERAAYLSVRGRSGSGSAVSTVRSSTRTTSRLSSRAGRASRSRGSRRQRPSACCAWRTCSTRPSRAQAKPRRPQGPGPPDRELHLLRADRRRENGARTCARPLSLR
jgi:ATP-dependent Clp protease ATP-binding subunit ClpC